MASPSLVDTNLAERPTPYTREVSKRLDCPRPSATGLSERPCVTSPRTRAAARRTGTCSSAWYELRTSGPEATDSKPSA